jgi:hypothetical protein
MDGIAAGLPRLFTLKTGNLTGPTPKLDRLVSQSRKDECLRGEVVRFLEAVDANHPAVFPITGIDCVGRHQSSTVLGRRRLGRMASLGLPTLVDCRFDLPRQLTARRRSAIAMSSAQTTVSVLFKKLIGRASPLARPPFPNRTNLACTFLIKFERLCSTPLTAFSCHVGFTIGLPRRAIISSGWA